MYIQLWSLAAKVHRFCTLIQSHQQQIWVNLTKLLYFNLSLIKCYFSSHNSFRYSIITLYQKVILYWRIYIVERRSKDLHPHTAPHSTIQFTLVPSSSLHYHTWTCSNTSHIILFTLSSVIRWPPSHHITIFTLVFYYPSPLQINLIHFFFQLMEEHSLELIKSYGNLLLNSFILPKLHLRINKFNWYTKLLRVRGLSIKYQYYI